MIFELNFSQNASITLKCLAQPYRQKVVDNENVNNHHLTIVRTYSGDLTGTSVPACRNSSFLIRFTSGLLSAFQDQ
jgi:hypothetical protein